MRGVLHAWRLQRLRRYRYRSLMRICAVAIAQVEVLVQSCAGVIYFNMQQTYTCALRTHPTRACTYTTSTTTMSRVHCAFACACACVNVYACACVCMCMHACTCLTLCIAFTCMPVFDYEHIYMQTRTCACMCMRAYVYVYVYACTMKDHLLHTFYMHY